MPLREVGPSIDKLVREILEELRRLHLRVDELDKSVRDALERLRILESAP